MKNCPFTLRLHLFNPIKNKEEPRYTYHIIQNTKDYSTGAFVEIEVACSTIAGPITEVYAAGLNHIEELMKTQEDTNGRTDDDPGKTSEKRGCQIPMDLGS